MAEYRTVNVSAHLSNTVVTVSAVSISDTVIIASPELSTVVATSDLPVYQGSYDVIPDWSAQTLNTAHKSMTDNVRVASIQLESVSNPSGGRTVYIGGII